MAVATRSPTVPFIVSFGGEDFLLDRDIERARAWTGRSLILLDGQEVDEFEIVSLCEEQTERPRTIIVDDAQKVKIGKALPAFAEAKLPGDMWVTLVAVLRSEKLSEGWSNISRKGKAYEHKKFKPWEQKKVAAWLESEAPRYGVSLETGAADLLVQMVGADLYRLTNELRKLAMYVGPKGTVRKEHFNLIVSKSPQTDQFQIAEAAIAKEGKRAMNALSIYYRNEGDDALVPIVSALMKQVEKTLIVRKMLDKGVSEADMASALGMNPWVFKEKFLPHVRKHVGKDLVRHMGRLCKLDVDVKSAANSKRTLVELAVLAIAG